MPFYRPFLSLRLSLLLAPAVLAGCMVGPDYKQPTPIISPTFKELRPAPGWQYAAPQLASLPKGSWWTIYNDPQLNALEAQVDINNQNIIQYEARYRNARATINSIRAQLYPTLSGALSFNRQSSGRGSRSSGTIINYGSDGSSSTSATPPTRPKTPMPRGQVFRGIWIYGARSGGRFRLRLQKHRPQPQTLPMHACLIRHNWPRLISTCGIRTACMTC